MPKGNPEGYLTKKSRLPFTDAAKAKVKKAMKEQKKSYDDLKRKRSVEGAKALAAGVAGGAAGAGFGAAAKKVTKKIKKAKEAAKTSNKPFGSVKKQSLRGFVGVMGRFPGGKLSD